MVFSIISRERCHPTRQGFEIETKDFATSPAVSTGKEEWLRIGRSVILFLRPRDISHLTLNAKHFHSLAVVTYRESSHVAGLKYGMIRLKQ